MMMMDFVGVFVVVSSLHEGFDVVSNSDLVCQCRRCGFRRCHIHRGFPLPYQQDVDGVAVPFVVLLKAFLLFVDVIVVVRKKQ
jgi:hypothetical protein